MDKDKNNKILIFCVTYFPFVGGAEVAAREITERLSEYSFELITAKISKNLKKTEKIGNTLVYRVGLGNKLDKYLYPFLAYFLACRLRRKNNYSLIWSVMETWAGLAALLFKFFHKQTPYLLTMQSGDSDAFIKKRTWFWHFLYKQVYLQADRIQVISNWLADRARNFGYRGEIDVIPNGVNLERFKIKNLKFEKKDLNLPEDNKIVFTASRLVAKNNLEKLIKAFAWLVTSCQSRTTLLVAGLGPLESNLKNLTKELKIEDKVIFLGEIPYEQIQDFYRLADVFVRPSLSEGFGNAFIEAMAAGVPVVAPLVGGIEDFLIDGETGLVCDSLDEKNIAEKIKKILTDSALAEKLKTNGCKLVNEKYDWNIIAAKMKLIFEKLIKQKV